ncbi:MAG: phosphatase PAP2 family protein [Kofleriaceae bacterium]
MRSLGVLATIAFFSTLAGASPDERTDRSRYLYQPIPIAAGGAIYLVLELGLKDQITPMECRWCRANGLDASIRNALVWKNVQGPNQVSNLTGYIGNPALALGGLFLSNLDTDDRREWYDDAIPVLQAGVVTGMVNQLFKVVFGRRRPYAEFKGTSTRAANDVNMSFFSGHTSLAFAMATSSATVASMREYRSAPLLWGGGLALATATGYFRIAADAHYFTDVLVGAIVGGAIGVAVPLLFHDDVLTNESTATPRVGSARSTRDPVIFSLYGGAF